MRSRIKMSKVHSPRTREQETARPAHKSQNGRKATEAWFEGEPAETELYVFPALKIGRVDSPEEREADEMAQRVVGGEIVPDELARMPQRVAGQSEEGGLAVSPPIADRIQARSGQGESLPETDREFFEPRFGRGFEDVVIHRDGEAASLARGLNAKAFTVGSDIYFGSGQYSQSEDGRRLMAHELTHTVQQGAGGMIQRYIAPPDIADYAGLLIDAIELAYIELNLPEGDYKNFRRLLNALFWAIDILLAATPGAGGGGVVLRIAGQGGGSVVWRALPGGVKAEAVRMAAQQIGMPVARATQMVNAYFAATTQIEKKEENLIREAEGIVSLSVWTDEIDRAAAKEPGIWGPHEIPSQNYPEISNRIAEIAKLLSQTGGPEKDPEKARRINELIGAIRELLRVTKTKYSTPRNNTNLNHIRWFEKLFNSFTRPSNKGMSP